MIRNDGKMDVEEMKQFAEALDSGTAGVKFSPELVEIYKRGVENLKGADMLQLSGDTGFSLNDDFVALNLNTENYEAELEDESLYENGFNIEDSDGDIFKMSGTSDADAYAHSLNALDFQKLAMKGAEEPDPTVYWRNFYFRKHYTPWIHVGLPYDLESNFNNWLTLPINSDERVFAFKIIGANDIAITGILSNALLHDENGDWNITGKQFKADAYAENVLDITKLRACDVPARFKHLVIPDTITFNNTVGYVRYIAPEAFADLHFLKTVKLGCNVQVIGDRAFSGCSNLKAVEGLNHVLHVGESVFQGTRMVELDACNSCFNLLPAKGAVISELDVECETCGAYSVITKYLGDKTDIIIPEYLDGKLVLGIAPGVFKHSGVRRVVLPACMKYVGADAFKHSDLTSIDLANVQVIGDSAFENCLLTSVTVPDTVTNIGIGVFAFCQVLRHVTLPQTLMKIPVASFADCVSLRGAMLPKYCLSVGNNAFYNCRALRMACLPAYLEHIGDSSFRGSGLAHIELPKNLMYLGNGAFSDCYALESVWMGKCDYISEIPWACFQNCEALKDIRLNDSIRAIGLEAFKGCLELRSLQFPASLKVIGPAVFYGCKSLQVLILPDTVRDVGKLAFAGCTNLISVTFDGMYVELGKSCFKGDSELKSVIFRYPVKGIPEKCFEGCSSLINVALPTDELWGDEGVVVSDFAFKDCESLKYITFPSDSSVSDKAFDGTKLRMFSENSFRVQS